jgi:hypothetical protein
MKSKKNSTNKTLFKAGDKVVWDKMPGKIITILEVEYTPYDIKYWNNSFDTRTYFSQSTAEYDLRKATKLEQALG